MMDPVIGKGPSAIDYVIEQAKNDPVGWYGPWLVGLIVLTLMAGIVTSQATRYFSTFGFESRGLFTVVVLSILLMLTQWIAILNVSWVWFVARFGDYRAFAEVPWEAWLTPIIGQVTAFVSQLFFARRCYTLYHRNKLIFGGLLFATDLAIAGLTLWKLGIRGGQSYSANTDDVLRRLRNLTIEAAVPPAICALLNVLVYLETNGKNLAYTAFAITTPSLYVCSLLFTLNSRRSIRQKLNAPNEGGGLYNIGFELSNVLGSGSKARQTESRRTTIVFAPMSGPTFAANASMGVVDERVEGSQGPELYGRRSGDDDDDDEPTTPGTSH
ncbi:hypothetical protein FRC05_005205 [Tulasnella sp. 425]|nr:hypothetical protein FRC05_005205 [Tulasnella sp. 425]